MKRKINLFVLIASAVMLSVSCKKSSSSSSSSNTSNSTNSNFTLKYEIITSSSIISGSTNPFGSIVISYNNETQQLSRDYSFTSGSYWSKELTVTTQSRPYGAYLDATSICIRSAGTVTSNIYVNGNIVAHVQNPTTIYPGTSVNSQEIHMSYVIQ